jgi:predicted dehydrogenase/nucleoside-diphosphate-sugar epimerase
MNKVCIVGAGFISKIHAEALRSAPQTELVAVCDTSLSRAKGLAKTWKVPHVFGSVDELIASKICNFAHVVVPPDLHHRVTEPLLKAGINVFLEKPMAVSMAQCESLIATAKQAGVKLGLNHNATFHPAFLALSEKLKSGEFGNLHHVIAYHNVPLRQITGRQFSHWMFQAPQNIVLEQASHPFSQIHALTGRMLKSQTMVSGRIELAPGKPFYDTWQVTMECERATVQSLISVGQDYNSAGMLAICEDGIIQADYVNNRCFAQHKYRFPDFFSSYLSGSGVAKDVRSQSLRNMGRYLFSTLKLIPRADEFFVGFRNSVEAFYKAINEGGSYLDEHFGAEVVRMCEEVSAMVAIRPASVPVAASASATLENSATLEKEDKKKVDAVIIGGTGFIGTHLVRQMVEAGMKLSVVARNTRMLPEIFHHPQVQIVSGDIANRNLIFEVTRNAPVVIHLAHGGGGDTWEDIKRSMVDGTLNVAEACLENKVPRLIYVGTIASLYLGDQESIIKGDTPNDPQSETRGLYSRGKALCDDIVMKLHREKGLPVCVLRPGLVIGEGTSAFHSGLGVFNQDGHCIGWNQGNNPLPLVLAQDVAKAILLAAKSDNVMGRTYNLIGDVRYTAKEYFAELSRVLNRPLKYYPQPTLKLQTVEIGKWVVKQAIGRRDAPFPSYRDILSRGNVSQFDCSDFKRDAGWQPVQDRTEFLRLGFECHRKTRSAATNGHLNGLSGKRTDVVK